MVLLQLKRNDPLTLDKWLTYKEKTLFLNNNEREIILVDELRFQVCTRVKIGRQLVRISAVVSVLAETVRTLNCEINYGPINIDKFMVCIVNMERLCNEREI